MLTVAVIALLFPVVLCQGGMAELKSITGDEPYRGLGTNPPAMIPRPMGFWGRPRYAPTYGSAFMGGGPYYSPYGGGGRFTSISYSPYGLKEKFISVRSFLLFVFSPIASDVDL
ncbi:hypothetical protein RB195_002525 [Necator americanus]|uniref:Sulfur globule protein CV3 domain protein n=1 Tax=Necator americanus TaxID=51031 RepID=A0ABR1DJE9_NECAM